MPFVSKKQASWAFTPSGVKALGGQEKVKEWADSTDYANLPEKKTDETHYLGGAVKKPKGKK